MRLFFLLIIMISCSLNNNSMHCPHWELIPAKGLKESNEKFYKLILIDKKNGLLLGTNYSNRIALERRFSEQNAVIYKTQDGGLNWLEKKFGFGVFVDAVNVGDTVFVVKNNILKGFASVVDSSEIFVSFNKGENWSTLSQFPLYIRDIMFLNSKVGVIVGKNMKDLNTNWVVLRTIDSGKTWNKIFEEKEITSPILNGNDIFYLTQSEASSGSKNFLVKKDIRKGLGRDTIQKGMFIYFYSFMGSDIIFLGRDDTNRLRLFALQADGTRRIIKEFEDRNLIPYYLSVSGAKILIIMTKLSKSYDQHKILSSNDSGASWCEEEAQISDYFGPIGINGENAISFSGAGRIQKRINE